MDHLFGKSACRIFPTEPFFSFWPARIDLRNTDYERHLDVLDNRERQ